MARRPSESPRTPLATALSQSVDPSVTRFGGRTIVASPGGAGCAPPISTTVRAPNSPPVPSAGTGWSESFRRAGGLAPSPRLERLEAHVEGKYGAGPLVEAGSTQLVPFVACLVSEDSTPR